MEEENESDHFEPIRMRLMADEMFQLTFQIENLDPKPRMSRSITKWILSILKIDAILSFPLSLKFHWQLSIYWTGIHG